jgi:hypothetical protein
MREAARNVQLDLRMKKSEFLAPLSVPYACVDFGTR